MKNKQNFRHKTYLCEALKEIHHRVSVVSDTVEVHTEFVTEESTSTFTAHPLIIMANHGMTGFGSILPGLDTIIKKKMSDPVNLCALWTLAHSQLNQGLASKRVAAFIWWWSLQ